MRMLRSYLSLAVAASFAVASAAIVLLVVDPIPIVIADFLVSPMAVVMLALVVLLSFLGAVMVAEKRVRTDGFGMARPWAISNPATAPPA